MEFIKYIVFFFALFIGVPAGIILSTRNTKIEKGIFFTAIFLTCSLGQSINFVSREFYRGTSRGFEITLVDLCALILFCLVISRRQKYKIKLLPPGTFLYFAYFILSTISIKDSGVPLYSFFELWKMVRMYFLYWTLYNYIQDFDQYEFITIIISAIITYVFFIALQQKYLLHIYQTPGPFPHQNSLVMYMIIFASIIFSKVMNGALSSKKTLLNLAVLGMGGLCIIFTLSRGGLACFGLSLFLIFIYSYFQGISRKKIVITLSFFLIGSLVMIKAIGTIEKRFQTAPQASANTRIELAEIASTMANENTFGVGLNNFSLKIQPPYKYSKMRNEESRDLGGIVETTYLLIAGETGWINLGIFIAFIFSFYIRNFFNFFSYRKTELAYLPIGLIGGLTAIYAESTLEWVLKQTNNFYQLMIIFAIIGSMHKLIKPIKKEYKRKKKLSS